MIGYVLLGRNNNGDRVMFLAGGILINSKKEAI